MSARGPWRRSSISCAAAVVAAAVLATALVPSAIVRAEPSEPAPQAAPDAPQRPRGHEPGFLEALGRFVEESVGSIGSNLGVGGKAPAEATPADTAPAAPGGEAAEAVKDAATAVVRLPATGIVSGRERCPSAANGSPDCNAAADTVCRAKGYRGGRSLDIQWAERCPAQVYISGRPPAPGECRMETFVSRAVCQ